MTIVLDPRKMPGPAGGANILAAPVRLDGEMRTVGPIAVVAHARIPRTAPGALPVDADVRPHPHIGLVAISYLLDGAVTHRDSLGSRVELQAGHLGATVSGSGVVHSERFDRMRPLGGAFEMLQILLALPDGQEEVAPSFFHRAAEELPTSAGDGASVRWLFPAPPEAPAGLPTMPPVLLADVTLEAGAGPWSLPDVPERAVYVRAGEVDVGTTRVQTGQVAVVPPGPSSVRSSGAARLFVFGGTSVGPRYAWWNYIHSSLERIEAAKAAWRAGRVKLPDGDTESFTPCPPDDGRPLWRLNLKPDPDPPKT
jgi:redox-sensitive bicupin YhaK (pirin superfamily)